jgi:hypothetical protein
MECDTAESLKPAEKMTLAKAGKVMADLESEGVNCMLYGSLGVSIYVGDFKEFGDADLVVPPEWTGERWCELQEIMLSQGYELFDAKEHEFHSPTGESVAFAPVTIFERDGIEFDDARDVTTASTAAGEIRTFTPELFKRAYEFSVKDGYRTEERGKKDQLVIELLNKAVAL